MRTAGAFEGPRGRPGPVSQVMFSGRKPAPGNEGARVPGRNAVGHIQANLSTDQLVTVQRLQLVRGIGELFPGPQAEYERNRESYCL